MALARGFDISENNGEFDFGAHPGMDFGFFKATEVGSRGTHFDSQFARNMQASAEQYGKGFVRHAYGFAHPGEAVQPQVEALVSVAKDHGLEAGDHLMMDLEVTDGLSAAEVGRFGVAFCHLANKLAPGHRCIDYTFVSFAQEGNCAGQWPWRLFIANWDVKSPTVPAPWSEHGLSWKYWQFAAGSADGKVPDLDVFNGDRAQLLDFCRMPASRR